MSEIKYIIKFIRKEKYAEEFMNNRTFYANPVGFFLNLEEGQGDNAEASIIDKPLDKVSKDIQVIDMKNGTYIPVFCCYAVTDKDINGTCIINIDKRCINDFFDGKEGVAVVVEFDSFIKSVNSCIEVDKHGRVQYTKAITFDETVAYSLDPYLAVFRKKDKFDYQKEYRIAFKDNIKGVLKEKNNGVYIDYEGCGKRYYYEKNLNIIGQYKIEDFTEKNGVYFLDTNYKL